ncbi:hypothetical protein M413DRAFT_448430 [Hebeloma cylindrosporum]|uniref:Cyanovirin-N domain-containing protein n=1 Tax=Hebeloma cylindrosporum TaxID=76867 RepID=A0A0C3C217_HEBCY|nr:hypothetical protein M413DRAFT_448430 [Hebeloma cylindrosporum h7]
MLLSAFLSLTCISAVLGGPLAAESLCKGPQEVVSTEFIGANKNVKLEHISCNTLASSQAIKHGTSLQTRQVPSVCGAPCATTCFTPSGGGPDPNDCHIIADALRFDSQNIGPIFQVSNGTSDVLSLSFSSCTSFFLNQATTPLNYCRTDFASLIDFIAPNCQATQNAHGGLCVANDGRWFVQVQHV